MLFRRCLRDDDMTPAEIRHLLTAMLTGAVGHDEAYWLEQIGEVEKRPSVEDIHCGWRVSPIASQHRLAGDHERRRFGGEGACLCRLI